MLLSALFAAALVSRASALNVLVSNDDGWAAANVRQFVDALTRAGHNVLLSSPAENKSGSSSLDWPPSAVTDGCEFNSCPASSPAEGFNASDPRLNYVNSYPATSVKYGLQTLAPQILGGAPDIVLTGPNVGSNLGFFTVEASGTVGAACMGAKNGIPAIAFSGAAGNQTGYTSLPNAWSPLYADLATWFTSVVTTSGAPYLPSGVILNVNFPQVSDTCSQTTDVKWVFTRLTALSIFQDVETCGSSRLPDESTVVNAGCFASVSVLTDETKLDADAATQGVVYDRIKDAMTCFQSS